MTIKFSERVIKKANEKPEVIIHSNENPADDVAMDIKIQKALDFLKSRGIKDIKPLYANN